MRHTRSHTANRRSHHALKAPTLAVCSNCESHHRPHHMCQECGFYKGRLVIDMKAKNEARAARMTAKKEAIKGQQADEAAEDSTNAIPGEGSDVPPENVKAGKSAVVDAPEMAKSKGATPRKEQSA